MGRTGRWTAEERAAGLFTEEVPRTATWDQMKKIFSWCLLPDDGPSDVFIRLHAQTCT